MVPSKLPVFPAACKPLIQRPLKPVAASRPLQGDVAAVLVGDGAEEGRLWPLTKTRCAAAIPIAANYRLVDVAVSNCMNSSSVTKMFALTQFNSASLNAHLSRAYSRHGLLQVIAAYQSPEHQAWFQGDADAIRRCLGLMLPQQGPPLAHFLILPAHHLYRMDYNALIRAHQTSQADITVSCVKRPPGPGPCPRLRVDSDNIVLGTCSDAGPTTLASMGIYVISRQVMIRILRDEFPCANDLGRQIVPGAVSLGMKVKAYVFEGEWEAMDSISAFYDAGMEMAKQGEETGGYNFYDRECPVYTLPHCVPPSKITDSLIGNSVIGDGCFLNGCRINGSVLGLRTQVGYGAVVEDSIIMGSDAYQGFSDKEIKVSIGVGEGSLLRKAIIDKNARIGKGVMIINKDNVREGSRQDQNYAIVDGIVVVMKSAVIPDHTIL